MRKFSYIRRACVLLLYLAMINTDVAAQQPVFEWGSNSYLSKADPSGRFLWAKAWSDTTRFSTKKSVCTDVAIDAQGNIYMTGYIGGDADMDPGADTYILSPPLNQLQTQALQLING